MEEKKRLTATKAAIAKFREDHPTFTDEYLASSVENTYPDLYLDNLEVAIEIVKELYRRQEDLTDESFVALLREMTEGRKLVRYGKEVIKTGQIMAKVRQLLDEIYHDAHKKTVFWSQYPLSQDADVIQHFEELCKQKGRTLAQQLYAEFFGTSVNSDPTNSAVTSVIISAIAPSTGGFLSPVVFTNLTNALVPDSTAFRYRFVALCAFVIAVILFLRNRFAKDKTAAAE